MAQFDADTLNTVATVRELAIRTARHPGTSVVIWAVVSDGTIFVRSFRGGAGRWYRDLAEGGRAALEAGGRTLEVEAVPVRDEGAIARVSEAFLRKYRPSPYAEAMVKPDILSTTLRLDPAGG
ncbi:MAG: DUF2255 family protein [Alphaproteobacteria bacterium]|nr:DUF2255 family protein [Alphaproteobacteria bacterium]MCW5742517.1 DUF2255 family protein [Alphaproteobacteria bacterium]